LIVKQISFRCKNGINLIGQTHKSMFIEKAGNPDKINAKYGAGNIKQSIN